MAIDLTTLPARLRARRGCRSLRAIAPEIGVSFSMLSRVERGLVPNGTALAAIEQWLSTEARPSVEQGIAHIHVEINDASDALRQRLHDAVCSWQDVHRQNQELQALVNQQRKEVERLRQESMERCAAQESYRILARGRIAELETDISDLRAANHAYGRLLNDIRGALGAIALEDADLAEAARSLTAELVAARAFIAAARTAGVDGLCTPEEANRWLATLMDYKQAIGER